MKNVQLLIERDDIHQFFRNYWQTEEFRQSHERGPGGLIFDMIDKYADLPRFVFDATNEEWETPHFSSWWGGFQRRNYKSPGIHDAYGAHEPWHSGEMVYVEDMPYPVFCRKLGDNELGASVFSEIEIYLAMPSLRDKTFGYEIFADRILAEPDIFTRYKENPDKVRKEVAYKRACVMVSPDEKDRTGFWVSKFAGQNEIWFNVWRHQYNKVETAMATLTKDCRSMGRQDSMDKFMPWLTSPEITIGTDIPFPDEAEDFASSYMHLKKVYEREFGGLNPRQIMPPRPKLIFPG